MQMQNICSIINDAVTLIAVKREVAAPENIRAAGFPWSECQVRKLATSHCTNHIILHDAEGCPAKM